MEKLPSAALEVVLMVNVDEPEPATEGGLKLPVTPEGSADTLKFTVPLKPFDGVTVTV